MEAAHERGVLHRDLKPANIMIDGRGRVRITDFGIAIAAGEDADAGATMGTPAYMAPEQFTGAPATVRSDIYGLGLVLYEIYCGKKAFSTRTLAELREQKEHVAPRAPSEIRQGMDPIVEQQIMRCIDRDPQARPRSIRQLLASLPGGDPLAAAIAAGQTPSPEMVAASGLKEGLQPAKAVMLLIVVILGALGMALMNPRASLLMRNPNGKDPHVLADRAQEMIKTAGYTYLPADSASALDYDGDFVRYIQETNATPGRWDVFQQYSPVVFWFRQSPRILENLPVRRDQTVAGTGIRPEEPPLQYSGDVLVRLDMEGRLRSFTAIPPQTRVDAPGGAPDWKVLFSAAGLDPSQWTSVEPQWNPNQFADAQAAWTGTIPGTEFPGRIEAAAYRGKPVSFEIVGPWTRPARMNAAAPVRFLFVLLIGALTTIVIASVYLARRNLRLGRGDRRGASRIAIVVMGLSVVSWILNEHHVASGWELVLASTNAGMTLLVGTVMWVLYLALEPAVRRRQSSILVSWTRAWAGQWRDPVIGRDVLIGAALCVAVLCIQRLLIVAPAWLGYPEGALFERDIGYQFASSISLSRIFDGFMYAIGDALFLAMLFVVFRVVVRSERVACALWVLVISTLVFVASGAPIVFLPVAIIAGVLLLVVLLRVGVLCIAASAALNNLWNYPVTLNTSAWYAGLGYAAMILFAAATIYGFYMSLGGRRLQLFANADEAGVEPS
jgi:serine/threonine-protein kinase